MFSPMASAASVGFGMHGPNFGVGGGPHATAEGFLLALTLPRCWQNLTISCIWLICTAWDQQPSVDAKGVFTNDPICRGMTFVLNPEIAQTLGETQPRIQIASRKQATSLNVVPADSHLKELCEQFENGNHTTISVTDTCAIEIQLCQTASIEIG